MRSVLIDDITVVTMDGAGNVYTDAAIAVENGIIAYIGPRSLLPQKYEGLPRHMGRARVALPGFVNAHTHAAMTLLRGYADDLMLQEWLTEKIFPAEAKLEPEDAYFGAMLACAEMIRSGTTCFADMYFFMDDVARAVAESGMRASLSVGMGCLSSNPVETLEKVSKGAEFCRRWHGEAGGRITTMLGPHAPYTCSPKFIKDVAQAGRELGVGIHTHISETFREVEEITAQYGVSPVKHLQSLGLFDLDVLAAHCVAVSADDIRVMHEHGVAVAHNPGSNMKLASGRAPVTDMLSEGICVGLGTDGAASNNNLDMIEEMRLTGLLHKVFTGDPTAVPAGQCLEMATMGGARSLRLDDAIGSIEIGKRADLILVDFNVPHLTPFDTERIASHMVYAASAHDVSSVLIDGLLVMDEGRLTTIDEREIIHEVHRRARRLTE